MLSSAISNHLSRAPSDYEVAKENDAKARFSCSYLRQGYIPSSSQSVPRHNGIQEWCVLWRCIWNSIIQVWRMHNWMAKELNNAQKHHFLASNSIIALSIPATHAEGPRDTKTNWWIACAKKSSLASAWQMLGPSLIAASRYGCSAWLNFADDRLNSHYCME